MNTGLWFYSKPQLDVPYVLPLSALDVVTADSLMFLSIACVPTELPVVQNQMWHQRYEIYTDIQPASVHNWSIVNGLCVYMSLFPSETDTQLYMYAQVLVSQVCSRSVPAVFRYLSWIVRSHCHTVAVVVLFESCMCFFSYLGWFCGNHQTRSHDNLHSIFVWHHKLHPHHFILQ